MQTALIAVASVSMAAVAIVLVRDAFSSAEQRLLDEAEQQCIAAAEELAQQYAEQAGFEQDEPTESLPFQAQDMSLRGLASAVLRGYEGVKGGFLFVETGRLAGLAAPTRAGEPVGAPDAGELQSLATRGATLAAADSMRSRDGGELIATAVAPTGSEGVVAWARKRLTGASNPASERRRWMLAGLVSLALVGLIGVVSVSIRLRRGVEQINAGLAKLEQDFSYRLPPTGGELGWLSEAVNQMAERRASLEATVRRQDRLAALGKVVAGVAHEIRNPLNSIRLTLELLRRRLEKGAATGSEAAEAMGEVDRLDRILSRLLAFGKPSLEDRKIQALGPLAARSVKMVQDQALSKEVGIRLEELDRLDCEADVDAFEIEQVLLNLLLNAVEASPRGGSVTVRMRPGTEAVEVTIADEGGGVPEEIGEHVFDPYFTTKDSGAGLGLAVSREILLRHGGDLSFENTDRGAVFRMRLPRRRRTAA